MIISRESDLLQKLGKIEEALINVEKSLSLAQIINNPKSTYDAKHEKCYLFMSQGKYSEALKLLNDVSLVILLNTEPYDEYCCKTSK